MTNITPFITEKSVALSKSGKFTVRVDKNATKPEIAASIKLIFKLNPLSVKILNKKTLTKRKAKGMAQDRGYKKAVISLKTGETMPGFDSFLKEDSKKSKDAGKDRAKKKPEDQKAMK